VFLSINDSGGKPVVYVLDAKARLTHTCTIENAKNVDWEAITMDTKGNVYIGDFGNNNNDRSDLTIYRLKLVDVLSKSVAKATSIQFYYPDQHQFPPDKANWYYDNESLIAKDDSLFIFTKNRTKPFDGKVMVYGLANQPGTQKLKAYAPLSLPETSWLENSVTDACVIQNTLFLLTYRYVYVFNIRNSIPQLIDTIEFDSASQKEGLTYSKGALYLTDEKTILGAAKLYKINYPL